MTLVAGIGLLAWFVRQQMRSAEPMLDLSLFSRPAISMGMVMALVVCGSLAGVELTVAQELQFVVAYSPLQAGLFHAAAGDCVRYWRAAGRLCRGLCRPAHGGCGLAWCCCTEPRRSRVQRLS